MEIHTHLNTAVSLFVVRRADSSASQRGLRQTLSARADRGYRAPNEAIPDVAIAQLVQAVRCARHRYGGPMSSVRQFQVTFDCAQPERVARFWCQVLGYVVAPPPEGFATWDDFHRSLQAPDRDSWFACVDPSGAGPRLFFQRVPEGKVVKNRVHLDVRVGTGLVGEERLATLEAECARLVALGAVRVRVLLADEDNESCIVMQDVEGNEFDLD
jgi:hypothetical protein